MFRSAAAMSLLGLAACTRPVTAAESTPPSDLASTRSPDLDVEASEPEPEPEPDMAVELDPSLIAPVLPEDHQARLSWDREDSPSRGAATMVLRATVLRGVGPDRVRGIRVTVCCRGATGDENAPKASFDDVRLRVLAAPGVRFVGGTGMVPSADKSGIDATFRSATAGVRRELDILFIAEEGLVGRQPIATMSLEYVRQGRSRERKRERKQRKVFATLR